MKEIVRYNDAIESCRSRASVGLSESLRERICEAAIQLMENIKYVNAGTVEFLVSGDEFFFIRVNPRVQLNILLLK